MTTVFDLFFDTGRSIQAIFKLGFIPRDEDYRNMTEEELAAYKKAIPDENEEMYILQTEGKNVASDGLICISETERSMLNDGVQVIQNYLKGMEFENDEKALAFVADRMPDVFSKGSRFERKEITGEAVSL